MFIASPVLSIFLTVFERNLFLLLRVQAAACYRKLEVSPQSKDLAHASKMFFYREITSLRNKYFDKHLIETAYDSFEIARLAAKKQR